MKIFIKEKVKIMVAVLFLIAAAIMHTEFVPVSYTHLDVYKRQVKSQRNYHSFGYP